MFKKRNAKDRRDFEKKIVSEMIDLYAKGHPEFQEAEDLKAYAIFRIQKCPFMETKTFCSACKVHCYKAEKREQIRMVMRWSGPRMLLHHPVMTLHHLWIENEELLSRLFWVCIGFIGLGLGVLGAILPLLPAFPFLLMAAFGFSRSSKRLHAWFLETSLYKKNIKSWAETRSMDKRTKIRVLTCISLVMLIGLVMMRNILWGQAVLIMVWIGHLLYFRYGIRTMEPALAAEEAE